MRGILRLSSALTLLTFVVCHLTNHSLLLISLSAADHAHKFIIEPWRTLPGTLLLTSAALVHYGNALWSVYVRRSLRLRRWQFWQLALGLCIPALVMLHLSDTRFAYEMLKETPDYYTILLLHWVVKPWVGFLQLTLVLVLWTHASIGIHFWLRTKRSYPHYRGFLFAIALILPSLALAGYVAGGNEIRREAKQPGYTESIMEDANMTPKNAAASLRIAEIGWAIQLSLFLLPFGGRSLRSWIHRLRQPPMLTHPGGKTIPMLPGKATVLETLQANNVPHAMVCGGRGRCTTCRVRVIEGMEHLPAPGLLEAKALSRLQAPSDVRLACQIRPTADLTILPLLSAQASAADGYQSGGIDGSERLVTVMFVDLRGSTTLGEEKMPYDVLYILNQFFLEMTLALKGTNGHYSNFTGDGLMALYGLEAKDPATGVKEALRGAQEMTRRLDALNAKLAHDLKEPLRMGIGIHSGEAIVGNMGPPGSQSIGAIGDTVNTTARLESLTKTHSCVLILSRQSADLAGLKISDEHLKETLVKGRVQTVHYYVLDEVPQ